MLPCQKKMNGFVTLKIQQREKKVVAPELYGASLILCSMHFVITYILAICVYIIYFFCELCFINREEYSKW